MLGDHQLDMTAPSLPPETNEEDDQMNDKDISYHPSFGLDSVILRAEAKATKEEAEAGEARSPYGSFRSKLNSFKSGFHKNILTFSTKSRDQFKPVRVKQSKLEEFEKSTKMQRKPIPNTNFFDKESENKLKVEKRPPSLPPDTHEEDDQMEIKSLSLSQLSSRSFTKELPALPNLSQDRNLYSIDNDSFSLSEISYSSASQSQSILSATENCSQMSDMNSSPVGSNSGNATPTREGGSQSKTMTKSNSIINMFKRSQKKEIRNPFYSNTSHRKSQESNAERIPVGNSSEMVDLTNEDSGEAIDKTSVLKQVQ